MRVGEPPRSLYLLPHRLDSTRPRPQPTPGLEVRRVGVGEGVEAAAGDRGQWCAPSKWRGLLPHWQEMLLEWVR